MTHIWRLWFRVRVFVSFICSRFARVRENVYAQSSLQTCFHNFVLVFVVVALNIYIERCNEYVFAQSHVI